MTNQDVFKAEDFITIPQGFYIVGTDKITQDAIGTLKIMKDRLPHVPERKVKIDSFRIGVFPVTNKQYESVIIGHKRASCTPLDDHPVVDITYHEALRFCEWTGTVLPTEEQWEVAARGKSNLSASVTAVPDHQTHNVWPSEGPSLKGKYPSNEFGVYDMAGNVYELTSTKLRLENGDFVIVVKGGSWGTCKNASNVGFTCYADPMLRSNRIGLRVCRT